MSADRSPAPRAILGALLLSAAAYAAPEVEPVAPVPRLGYTVVARYPHDPRAFTQGLVFQQGALYEGTGLRGRSTLREVDLKTGRPRRQRRLDPTLFGEGITALGGRIYQVTWQAHRGFVYDRATFTPEAEFTYAGEGWGLTHDGARLILSDGTATLRVLDPKTFAEVGRIDVRAGGRPVERLNELEWVRGEILANVWQTPYIVRISPTTGAVTGVLDLSDLLPPSDRPGTDVLNGIAYDAAGDRLFVTGKLWPTLFEIALTPAK